MKISEIKGERALEVIADLIDPITEMVKDTGFKDTIDNGDRVAVAKYLLKNHSKNVLTVLALINEEDPDTYKPSLIAIPKMLLDLFNDPDVMSLFGLQDQNTELASSGPAMENTEAK